MGGRALQNQMVLIQAITLVVVVLIFDAWERRRPSRSVNRMQSLGLDLLAICVVIVFGEFAKVLVMGGIDLAGLNGAGGYTAPLAGMPVALKILAGVSLADLGLYWVHRAMHGSDFLWRTHRFHHSITQLWWLSGARTSVTHLFLFAVMQMSVAYVICGLSPFEATVMFSFGVVVNIWVHANISVDLGKLQWLVITPDFHRIHHAADGRSRKNLGFVFTIWDRMFGTYLDPRSITDEFELGSAEKDKGYARQIVGI